MKILACTVCKNEAYMMNFFLRHYAPWVDEILIFDEHSTDGTRDIVSRCPKAKLVDWHEKGLNDDAFREFWNCTVPFLAKNGNYDWAIVPDVDELLWHPNIREYLGHKRAYGVDLVSSCGFNMLPALPPVDDGHSQFYDLCRLGVPVDNYSKSIIFNPERLIEFDYGRHYVTDFSGRKDPDPAYIKLLHCHFLGVEYTRARNKRNYDAAVNKKFAWNYDAKHNEDPNQVGSVAWVERMIRDKQRVDVFNA